MTDQRWFRVGIWTLLIFTIIWVGSQLDFIFQPLGLVLKALFVPLILSGVLFFLLRPPMRLLVSWKVPRALAILLLYLLLTGILSLLFIIIGPMIQTQFEHLMISLPLFVERAINTGYEIAQSEWFGSFLESSNTDPDALAAEISAYVMMLVNIVSSNLANFFGFIANVVLVLVIVPFILFYFLKDGENIYEGFVRMMPKKHQESIRGLLLDMDRTIGLFIRGQATVALSVGVLMFIGFQIIGLNYAVLLALLAMVTNVIPYIGAFLAAAPALLVGLAHSPQMAIKALIVTVIAQQLEGNLLSPLIMGKGLAIHPLTIILLLIVSGAVLGPVGLLFAIPGYAILKVIVVHCFQWYRTTRET